MQRSHKQGFAFLVVGVGVALLVGYATRRQQQERQREQALAYGCLTPAQVTSRAQALCRILTPQAGKVELTLEKYAAHPSKGSAEREWHVDCRNEAGEDLVRLRWNAESGELAQVSLPTVLGRKEPPSITPRSAEQCGWGWLRLLGMVNEPQQWRLVESAQSRSTVWWGHYEGSERGASVLVDLQTGNLMQAQCWLHAPIEPSSITAPQSKPLVSAY